MGSIKRAPLISWENRGRFEKISKADWADLYFDLYRQTCGDEQAPEQEVLEDAEKRLEILKIYRAAK